MGNHRNPTSTLLKLRRYRRLTIIAIFARRLLREKAAVAHHYAKLPK